MGCHNDQQVWQLASDRYWVDAILLANTQTLRHSNPPTKVDKIVTLLWSIWKTRNSKIFRNEISNRVITLLRAKGVSIK